MACRVAPRAAELLLGAVDAQHVQLPEALAELAAVEPRAAAQFQQAAARGRRALGPERGADAVRVVAEEAFAEKGVEPAEALEQAFGRFGDSGRRPPVFTGSGFMLFKIGSAPMLFAPSTFHARVFIHPHDHRPKAADSTGFRATCASFRPPGQEFPALGGHGRSPARISLCHENARPSFVRPFFAGPPPGPRPGRGRRACRPGSGARDAHRAQHHGRSAGPRAPERRAAGPRPRQRRPERRLQGGHHALFLQKRGGPIFGGASPTPTCAG